MVEVEVSTAGVMSVLRIPLCKGSHSSLPYAHLDIGLRR